MSWWARYQRWRNPEEPPSEAAVRRGKLMGAGFAVPMAVLGWYFAWVLDWQPFLAGVAAGLVFAPVMAVAAVLIQRRWPT